MDENIASPIFPKQAVPDSKKNFEWYRQNIEAGMSIVLYKKDTGLRADRLEKISNLNMVNDIIDKKEIESTINPYSFSGKFPDTYKNYPVANSNLNLLFGEEIKRLFNPISYVVNSDIVNSNQDVIDQRFKEVLRDNIFKESGTEEQFQQSIKNFDKWRKYTFQDMYSRMANQVIQHFLNTTDIRKQWSTCFEDLLIQGEEIFSIDILGGNVVFERINPLELYTFRAKDSYMVEDCDWICHSRFLPVGSIIDNYHDYLSADDLKYLEEVYMTQTAGNRMLPNGQLLYDNFQINDTLKFMGYDKIPYGSDDRILMNNRDIDTQGNIRITRVLWKSQRQIGFLEYRDDDGTIKKKYVDERYKINKEAGEKITYEYISEWHEGTKIGRDIYCKYGPRPIQFRDPDNPSICHPGIVGNILNTNSSRSKSLMSYMKPYQLLYNFFMYRLQQDFLKYQGHIARLNLTMIPDKWGVDKVMYYMQQFGIMVEDPFNEGQEGAATGKLPGSIGYNPSGNLQIGDANIIQMNIMMLDFLEKRISDISGVTSQRKGAIENRETLGGVERSVMQSANNTEKYYNLHDNFRLRCLRTIVETVKIAWKDKTERRTFVLDDGTKSILDFNGDSFKMGTYGIACNTSSDTTSMMNELKSLSQAYMQNGGGMSSIMDIYMTKDPDSLKRKIQQYEEEIQQQQQQSEERQLQVQQQQVDAQLQIEASRQEHERALEEMRINSAEYIKILELESSGDKDNSGELEKLKIQREKIKQDALLKEKQLQETIRHNKISEEISRIKKKTANK